MDASAAVSVANDRVGVVVLNGDIRDLERDDDGVCWC